MKNKVMFFAVIMMALAIPQSVRAYDFSAVAPSGQTLYYDTVDGTATVTFQINTFPTYLDDFVGDLIIPASVTYNNTTYWVTNIGEFAFAGCCGLTSVTISDSVTVISNYAFYGCRGLHSITLSDAVANIGMHAFSGCSGLTTITIPDSVKHIGNSAFMDCSGLSSMVVASGNTHYDSRDNCNAIIETSTNTLVAGCQNSVIPNSVTVIGTGAFNGHIGLTSVTIPGSVTTIRSEAFNDCRGLSSITIPNSVTGIGRSVFWGCSGLTSISVESGNTHYDSRDNCNAIIETSSNTLLAGCKNTIIPNTVTAIDEFAFTYCNGLTSIIIPNSVTKIGWLAFRGCNNLASVTFGDSLTTIGAEAFMDCSALEEIRSRAQVAPALGHDVFLGVPGSVPVYVPCHSTDSYVGEWGNYFSNFTEDCGNTEVEMAVTEEIRIYSRNGRIVVEGAEGQPFSVYDMMGHEVFHAIQGGETSALPGNVYLVKVGTHPARKVVVIR